jgi:hypothetical protein
MADADAVYVCLHGVRKLHQSRIRAEALNTHVLCLCIMAFLYGKLSLYRRFNWYPIQHSLPQW